MQVLCHNTNKPIHDLTILIRHDYKVNMLIFVLGPKQLLYSEK